MTKVRKAVFIGTPHLALNSAISSKELPLARPAKVTILSKFRVPGRSAGTSVAGKIRGRDRLKGRRTRSQRAGAAAESLNSAQAGTGLW